MDETDTPQPPNNFRRTDVEENTQTQTQTQTQTTKPVNRLCVDHTIRYTIIITAPKKHQKQTKTKQLKIVITMKDTAAVIRRVNPKPTPECAAPLSIQQAATHRHQRLRQCRSRLPVKR